jgi:signal recognition particle receptor subunit beta
MVFFNYSTMQMAAKVVYYGPGLCGKTTNLHYIYQHTTGESRGEMVSLETETDRTLFFDLLPIDVGSIAGFNTRIQLYTVPGQVFYNTTRKLVLKGVDGVVFVADSQRAMLQANVESFRNLEENLTEMGLAVDTLPLVLQFNKRDLADICTAEEMNAALNRYNWPFFEASAVTGQGVFETLKGISRFTLMSLKKRLGRSEPATAPAARPAATPAAAPPPLAVPRPAPVPAVNPAVNPATNPAAAPPRPAAPPKPLMPPMPPPASPPAAAPPPWPAAAPAPPKAPPVAARGRTMDVLSELEKLRREAAAPAQRPAQAAAPSVRPAPVPAPPAGTNGRGELSRSIELTLRRADLQRARRVLVSFQVEDDEHRVMDSVRDLPVDIPVDTKAAAGLEKLLLRLNIALNSKE